MPFFMSAHLKHVLENYVFCRKSGSDACSRRWGKEEGLVVWLIMSHFVQKLICNSLLIP